MVLNNAYEEVYQILKNMNKETVMRVPKNVLNNIITNRNSNFKTCIDKKDLFNQENISKEAMDLICYIAYNYWLDSDEKQKIDIINQDFYRESEKRKEKKYNPDSLFNKNKELNLQIQKDNFLMEYKDNKTSLIKRIIKKIIKFFNR